MPLVAMRPVGLAAIVAELALLGAVKSCCRGSDRVRSSVDVKLRRLDREKAIEEVWRKQGNWLSTAAAQLASFQQHLPRALSCATWSFNMLAVGRDIPPFLCALVGWEHYAMKILGIPGLVFGALHKRLANTEP
ncbi:hypothetical protein M441DRAFT_44908 [Trichoderma asperellum CBS 433.97]|uniref:Uncharacterized protein n=1 Tax=Trichoderma asperellum (strain ATCC 204424 / CBS 433.97 / NBRC 101777) TaxID=1042311 RepID=A0A2T3ZDH3_TRIA4|nr:hypothetical protein M441DRAFT_44908 [Trichoderma asperellum CBS 433.97]PTB42862.1 hypothetical protein M441DRAFT_44908 [Trichoderma asperellum CBS 433.97]